MTEVPNELPSGSLPCARGVALTFNVNSGRPRGGKKPWRKSASAVKRERTKISRVLGRDGGGVDFQALRVQFVVQEMLDGCAVRAEHTLAVQAAATKLLQVSTNDETVEDVGAACDELKRVVTLAGLADALDKATSGVSESLTMNKLQLVHEVVPRLWIGGWTALRNECSALKKLKITHVLSVLSATQRRLPRWIKEHCHIYLEDNEKAAGLMGSKFQAIVEFIESARSAGGVVFVHCGAGISRAPTAASAWLIWKFNMSARSAIKLCRQVRKKVRPNVGFVGQLKKWEAKVKQKAENQTLSS